MSLEVGALSLGLSDAGLRDALKTIKAVDKGMADIAKTNDTKVNVSFQRVGKMASDMGRQSSRFSADQVKHLLQVKTAIDSDITALAAYGKTIDVTNQSAVKGFMSSANAQRELMRTVGATDAQFKTLDATIQKVGASSQRAIVGAERQAVSLTNKMAGSARSIATAGAVMASTGNLAAGSIARMIAGGAQMAFMFGVGGPIVGAVGITAFAIYQLFSNTRKDIEETAKKASDELRNLSLDAANLALLAMGPDAATTGVRIDELRKRAATLRENKEGRDPFFISGQIDAINRQIKKLIKVGEEYQGIKQRIADILDIEMHAAKVAKEKADLAEREAAAKKDTLASSRAELRIAQENARLAVARIQQQQKDAGDVLWAGLSAREKADILWRMGKGPEPKMEQVGGRGTNIFDNPTIKRDISRQIDVSKGMEQTAAELNAQGALLIDNLVAGMQRGFQSGSISGMLSEIGKGILAGLGSLFVEMGKKIILASELIQKALLAITGLFPGAGIAAGIGLIVLGSAMGAMGGRGGRGGGRGGGYGGGGTGRREEVTTVRVGPTSAREASKVTPAQPMNVYIFGKDDPTVQREFLALMETSQRRTA